MTEPTWVEPVVVYRIHELQILAYGGLPGIRDDGLIESAIARPKHMFGYGSPDLIDLAAAYTAGLCQNHGFLDGNKRTGFVVAEVFLRMNGFRTQASQAEVVAAVESLTDHTLSEAGYANWLRDHAIAAPE